MTLRDILRKKDKFRNDENENPSHKQESLPSVTIMRSDTNTFEIIKAPSFGSELVGKGNPQESNCSRRPSDASQGSRGSGKSRRLSSFLHFRTPSQDKASSINLPSNLPPIEPISDCSIEDTEAQWEKRATILAQGSTAGARGNDLGIASQTNARSTNARTDVRRIPTVIGTCLD